VISIFELRTIKAFSASVGHQVDVRRARTSTGWFNMVVDGEDVVVKAEAEDAATQVQGIAEDLHTVEKSHTEHRRQEARKEIGDKHLKEHGIARAKTVGAASIAFTASAIEFHNKRRGDNDSQVSIDKIHRAAQISNSVTRADDQPEVARLSRPVDTTVPGYPSKATYANPVSLLAAESQSTEYENPMLLSPRAELDDSESDEPVPEPELEEGTGPADIAPPSHANAMLHLDSSHHHAEFDEFIGATSNM
jgi:hypothetical protein